jgi:hypothetical protein
MVEPDRPQMTVWHLRIAYWIPTTTDTHKEYVMLIAVPLNNGCTNAAQCYVTCTLTVLHHSFFCCVASGEDYAEIVYATGYTSFIRCLFKTVSVLA